MALLKSLVLWPVVRESLPPLPDGVGAMAGWVIREVVTGLMIGMVLRILMTALTTAGEIIALQTTLSFAQTANPLQAQPGSTIASYLLLLGVTLVFATDTHHLFIAGMVGSYNLIAPAKPLLMSSFTEMAVRTLGDSFLLGVQLSAPVLVFALIFNLASGLIARVMPSFQVYFAAAPLSVILGLSIFALSLGALGTIFIDRYRRLAESKTEEATPRKLEEARKKGDVAKSQDVGQVLSLAGAAAVILGGGGYFAGSMAEQLLPFIASPHEMLGVLNAGAGNQLLAKALWAMTPFLGAVMLATIVGGAGGHLAQSGLIFTTEKLKPQWSMVNPLSGFKRIFGPDGLVQFLKTFLKLAA
ncbi:hypothetical protein LTR94_027426, partial [Friedmanniomyces endolithicus]